MFHLCCGFSYKKLDQKLSKDGTEFVQASDSSHMRGFVLDYVGIVLAFLSRVHVFDYAVDGGTW